MASIVCFLVLFLMSSLVDAYKNTCLTLEDRLLNMAMKCKCKKENGRVKEKPAFTATITSHPYTLSKNNQVVKFERVIFNRGKGYNPKTGKFTAPFAGLYQTSVTLMSNREKQFHAQIVKNGKEIMRLHGISVDGASSTGNPVLELKFGDEIYVKSTHGNTELIHGNNYSQFSVHFISE